MDFCESNTNLLRRVIARENEFARIQEQVSSFVEESISQGRLRVTDFGTKKIILMADLVKWGLLSDAHIAIVQDGVHGRESYAAASEGQFLSSPSSLMQDVDMKKGWKDKRKWDEAALGKLLIEYKTTGATQASLASQYGVSRSFIGEMLKKATDELVPRKASPFDVPGRKSRK